MKLEDVIRSKGNSVVTIAPSASVAELVSVMADNNIGAVVVSADGRHIAGIISERDIVRGLAGSGAGLLEATVADLMTDGCNMGVKSLNRYLNEYTAADEVSKDIAKRLINLEEQLAIDIREFL